MAFDTRPFASESKSWRSRYKNPAPDFSLRWGVPRALMVAGLLYAWYGLIPLLLDYLTTDAQQAGLSTEWRLSNYAGFIVNLLSASAIGFQAPAPHHAGASRRRGVSPATRVLKAYHLVRCVCPRCVHVAA